MIAAGDPDGVSAPGDGSALGGGSAPGGSVMAARVGRREFAVAMLLCLAGTGLALFAATRAWSVEAADRPVPLSGPHTVHTGKDLLPWLSPLALVGLAGVGAVLATRGTLRRLVAVLLLVAALGLVGGAAWRAVTLDPGTASGIWPYACALGGLCAAVGAALTVARGHRWPGMGARYERDGANTTGESGGGTAGMWAALDRGEDPTVG